MDISVLSAQPAIASSLAAAAALMALVYRKPQPNDKADVMKRGWQTKAAAVCLEKAAELTPSGPDEVDLTEPPTTIDLADPIVDLNEPATSDPSP